MIITNKNKDPNKDPKDVKIGRLYKKIEKLQKQRDHYKNRVEYFQNAIHDSYLDFQIKHTKGAREQYYYVKKLETENKQILELNRLLMIENEKLKGNK